MLDQSPFSVEQASEDGLDFIGGADRQNLREEF
jgi:hypothetical protein